MNVDEAIIILLVAQSLGSVLMYFVFRRETRSTIDGIFGQPLVKGAMSVLGKKSGEVRHESAMMDQVANTILNSPQAKVLKMAGKQLGFDVDEMVAEQGPGETMEMILTAADMMKIDISGILGQAMGGLNSAPTEEVSTDNPYLGK